MSCFSCCNRNEVTSVENNFERLFERDQLKSELKTLRTVKLLPLGAGESGKSTLVGQLQRIHEQKRTPKDDRQLADALHECTFTASKDLLTQVYRLKLAKKPLRGIVQTSHSSTDGCTKHPDQCVPGQTDNLSLDAAGSGSIPRGSEGAIPQPTSTTASEGQRETSASNRDASIPQRPNSTSARGDGEEETDRLNKDAEGSEEQLEPTAVVIPPEASDNTDAVVAKATDSILVHRDAEQAVLEKMLINLEDLFAHPIVRLGVNDALLLIQFFNSKPAQAAWERRAEFSHHPSYAYWMRHLMRICGPNFQPTDEDYSQARIRTTGFTKHDLTTYFEDAASDAPIEMTFSVIDVGGQRMERRKWRSLGLLNDVDVLILMVNLAGYCQVLFEESGVNCMIEELNLFEELVNSPSFRDASIHVVFNKIDVFRERIEQIPLSRMFPDFSGDPKNSAQALEYIKCQFLSRIRNPQTHVDTHVIAASNIRDVKPVYTYIRETIWESVKGVRAARIARIEKQLKQFNDIPS